MTVAAQTPSITYTAVGAATVFPFPFRLLDASYLTVLLDGAAATGYVVTLGDSNGGYITFGVAPTGRLVIERNTPFKRDIDYQVLGNFQADTVDEDFDRQTMLLQEAKVLLTRSLRVPQGESVGEFPAAAVRANNLASFDGAGNPTVVLPAAGTATALGVSLLSSIGASIVGWIQAGTGAVFRLVQDKLRERVSVEDFGAVGGGTRDDAAFAAAAAVGKLVRLRDGANYLVGAQVAGVNGTRFFCPGKAKITVKTGVGAFNTTDLTASKDAAARCLFLFQARDDVGIEGVEFVHDGGAVLVYPIRCNGGTATRGCDFKRLTFRNFPVCNGGMVSLNTIGRGGARYEDIEAFDCGTASTAWTGTPQITVLEIDNDMLASVPSEPTFGKNIRGVNIKFSGAALASYGQQTDIVNVAGIATTDRKGPTIIGIYGDGCGELLDIFCRHASIKGIRGRDCVYGVKLIHGAAYNQIECDTIENFGQAAVTIAGSASVVAHTQHNSIRVGVIRQSAGGPAGFTNRSGVMMQDNSGGAGTCLPKSNVIRVDKIIGDGVNMDYAVRDSGASNANGNFVEVGQGSGWVTKSVDVSTPANTRVRWLDNTDVKLTMSAAQAMTTTVQATVNFNTTVRDINTESLGTGVVRAKYPGKKSLNATVRWQANAVGDECLLQFYKNTTPIASHIRRAAQNAQPETYSVSWIDYCGEDEVNAATADYMVKATITAGGSPSILNTAGYSQFEVVGV